MHSLQQCSVVSSSEMMAKINFKGLHGIEWAMLGGKLTDDQLDVIAGKRDHLARKLQESHSISKDESVLREPLRSSL